MEAAGFSPWQGAFKLDLARRMMWTAERRPARFARLLPRRPSREQVGAAFDAVKEVLGSIKGLSKYLEAAGELVGVVGSAVKTGRRKLVGEPPEVEVVEYASLRPPEPPSPSV